MAEVPNTITLKNVRISFMDTLWTAGQVQGEGKPQHRANFLLSADDPQVEKLQELITKVMDEAWKDPKTGPAIKKQIRGADRTCLHDGNTKAQWDGYADNWFVSAGNPSKVLVIDRDRTPLAEGDGKPYSGCYVDVNIQVWAQDNNWGKRVNASLRWVQFRRDGDAFAGTPPASVDEVPDISEDDGEDEPLV